MSNNTNSNYRQQTIILNSTNYVNGSGNRFQYTFPGSQMQFLSKQIHNILNRFHFYILQRVKIYM